MTKTNQEQQIELLGKVILDGNLSKEDREYAIYWRDNLKSHKKITDEIFTPILNQCNFEEAWIGRCKETTNTNYCSKHTGRNCYCGKQATHNCDVTIGPLVCGQDLCGNCRCRH